MPVEIRELIIRATVNSQQSQTSGDADADMPAGLTEADRSSIVRTAVEEVLRILKASKER